MILSLAARVARRLSYAAVACVCVAACSSSTAKSAKPTASSSAAPPTSATTASAASTTTTSATDGTTGSTGSAGGVTFDGAYRGTVATVVCTGSGSTTTAQVTATYTGDSAAYTGDFAENELGFEGPDNTQFDSGFVKDGIDPGGNGFEVDGITATDQSSGKAITLHGTLRCP